MTIDLYTDYSLLNSLIKIEDLVATAKEKGWKWLGIADNNAGGLLDFYLACTSAGIRPILGLRFYVVTKVGQLSSDQILLYAKNELGYRALLKLSTKANIDGFYGEQPHLLIDWLTPEMCENLLCVLPAGESPFDSKNIDGEHITNYLSERFQSGNRLILGLYDRNCSIDDYYLKKAKEFNLSYIPLSGAKYLKSDEFEAFKTLRAIATHSTVEKLFETVYLDESLEAFSREKLSTNCQEMIDRFVNLVDIKIPTPGLKVPKFKIPEKFKTSYDYLVDLCRKGYKNKQTSFQTPEENKACSDRMKIELDVIKRCELADYFLLVYDICKYCDTNNIPRGISRGSAGSSLIVYLLDISRVNPLSYGLLFERFLNEDRTKPIDFNGEKYLTDAPDIDLDVGQIQRQQIVDFLRNGYGNVAKIVTWNTMSAKAAIKDAMRAFGKPEYEANYVSSCIEILFGRSDELVKTYEKSEKFRTWADKNKKIYEIALKIENCKKNRSIHAAGLVISNENIDNRAPLFLANYGDEGDFKKDVCIGYSLDFAAKAGLLKIDLLGLRCLNVLQDCINLIPK